MRNDKLALALALSRSLDAYDTAAANMRAAFADRARVNADPEADAVDRREADRTARAASRAYHAANRAADRALRAYGPGAGRILAAHAAALAAPAAADGGPGVTWGVRRAAEVR